MSPGGVYSCGIVSAAGVYTCGVCVAIVIIVNMTSVEISKTPVEALNEAFPGAQLSGGIGVGSRAAVPTSGQIIVEDMRLFYYNWHGARGRKLGESYELLPYYRIKALLSGPDERLIHQEIRVNVEIMAIDARTM